MSWPGDVIALLADRFGITELPDEGPEVPRDRLVELATALKTELGFTFFVGCAAAHYPSKKEEGKDDVPERTMVWYRVRRLPGDVFAFRVYCPTGESVPTLSRIWAGADWQEREQYDLVGTLFSDHPDLRRLMLPEDWEGHPLRRDYAIETRHAPWR